MEMIIVVCFIHPFTLNYFIFIGSRCVAQSKKEKNYHKDTGNILNKTEYL